MSIRARKGLLASSLLTIFLVGCNSDSSDGDALSTSKLELSTLSACSFDDPVDPTENDYQAAVATCSPSSSQNAQAQSTSVQSTLAKDTTYFRINNKGQVRSFEAQSDGKFIYHYIGAGGESGTASESNGSTRFDWLDPKDGYILINVIDEDAQSISALIYEYYFDDDTSQYETTYYSSLFAKAYTPVQCKQRDNPNFENNLTDEHAVTKTEFDTIITDQCRVTLGGKFAKFDEARLIKAQDVYSGDGEGNYERFVFDNTPSSVNTGWYEFEIRDKDDALDSSGEWKVNDDGALLLTLTEKGIEYEHQLYITATDGFTTMVKVFTTSDEYINQGFATDVGSLSSLVMYSQEPDF
ncbi:hypothetical protein OH456_14720 [Vibrio sp. La 4.2.2]|uniref:hypothetical protein n=1 Tax=Vibrio sp. La 4.2.2 TaxID=2998830 RepID=UPI0022CE1042|nr:hypothetical protein [Vibrio sp. La 4.2.2]MDA0109415.1 hypothetical protein [Vibrio sp. La 4.2.2]